VIVAGVIVWLALTPVRRRRAATPRPEPAENSQREREPDQETVSRPAA
jgi:hypothetical protein